MISFDSFIINYGYFYFVYSICFNILINNNAVYLSYYNLSCLKYSLIYDYNSITYYNSLFMLLIFYTKSKTFYLLPSIYIISLSLFF